MKKKQDFTEEEKELEAGGAVNALEGRGYAPIDGWGHELKQKAWLNRLIGSRQSAYSPPKNTDYMFGKKRGRHF